MRISSLDKTNLGLLLLFLLLAVPTWFIQKTAMDTRFTPLSNHSTAEVKGIDLFEGNELRMSLLKTDKGWDISHPDVAEANTSAVQHLLKILNAQSHRVSSATNKELKRFGLSRPKYKLQLDEVTITFGDLDPITKARYVRSNDKVYLISEEYMALILRAPDIFIQR